MDERFYQEPLWGEGGDLVGALEALFTATGEILTLERLREFTGLGEGVLRQGIEALAERYKLPRGVRLLEVGGGWRLAIAAEYSELVAKLVTTLRSGYLTPAQKETLAIIAQLQPVTMPEICEIRRVSSVHGQVRSLLERDLVKTVGRRQVVGRPMMYATTTGFLLRFGLKNLRDLPRLADFGENNIEEQALAQLGTKQQNQTTDGLFSGSESGENL